MKKTTLFDRLKNPNGLTRRDFLKLGGGAIGAAMGAAYLGGKAMLKPERIVSAPAAGVQAAAPAAPAALDLPADQVFVGTDGWASLPTNPSLAPYHPDDLAPSPFNTYIFGFRNVTGLTPAQRAAQKMKAQLTAPMVFVNQGEPHVLELWNLGLTMRPDLFDSHTFHWHGFRNAIPYFDGEPVSTVAVPVDRSMKYYYNPVDAGTYMYHCHFEDTEHVHMGMTGVAVIYPEQNQGVGSIPAGKYVYNDGDRSTEYDREFVLLLTELWAFAHWCDSHIELPEWSDYQPDFWLINGRAYPDTLEPNSDPMVTPARPDLQYQPISSLITANPGDRVLLRFVNLGFQTQSMTLPGIKMRVIGKDATLLRGLDGTDLSYLTNTVHIGPGESTDVIFTAPGGPDTYLLYNRNLARNNNGGGPAYGGMMTEVRISDGSLPPQTAPNA